MGVKILTEDGRAWTTGLGRRGSREVAAKVEDRSLIGEADALLRHIADYVTRDAVTLEPEETMAYGYWLIRFREDGRGGLELWEYNDEANTFVPGTDLTLTYWRDQHRVCAEQEAEFAPPRPDRLAVLSAGVLEGDSVQGVRYPSPEEMSGWWITTDRYDGDLASLRREHLYHLTAARPDLARYIALPYGFRFDTANGEDVWFDQAVATQSP